VYFGSKLLVSNGVNVVRDRLGSVRANTQGERFAYYPYGEERTSTVDGRDKFATYLRDGVGQDYADQRYYNAGMGRFWTPDPGGIKTADATDPTSWNRYGYVGGDPINFTDRRGRYRNIIGSCDGLLNGNPQDGCDDSSGDNEGGECTYDSLGFEESPSCSEYDDQAVQNPPAPPCAPGGVTGDSGGCYTNVRSSGSGWASFAGTVGKLFKALAKDTKCIDWLGGNTPAGEAAVQAFMQQSPSTNFSIADTITSPLKPDGSPVYPGTINGSEGDNVPGGNAIVMNWGAFQNNSSGGQFLVLLHEMAHFFKTPDFDQDDGRSTSRANDNLVYKNCGKVLR